MCTPRAVSTSSSAARVGFSPIESSTSDEPGNSAAAQKKNAAEEMSPGTAASIACSFCGPAMETESLLRTNLRAKGPQRQLAVVAGAHGFAHRRGARRLQAGQQHARLHLRAGHRGGVVDRLQRCAFNHHRRVPIRQRDARAHFRKRFADSFHGPARQRLVADERKFSLLRRQQARNHAHGRAGVAAVERAVRGRYAAADARHFHRAVLQPVDARAQRLHATQRRSAIRARGEVRESRRAFGKRGQHAVAMADGLVAGQAQAAQDVARRTNNAFFSRGMQANSASGDRLSLTSSLISLAAR